MSTRFDPDWLVPEWDAPGVGAVMTTRAGGVGKAPFDSLNVRDGLGDEAAAVAENQRRLVEAIGSVPVWLKQVHGAAVVSLTSASGWSEAAVHSADACVTTEPGVVCAIQVADCLPVLFAAPGARGVAAAHAGWRGLAAGVLESSVGALCESARCEPGELQAWLGACIGPRRFEVGPDVLEAFGADPLGESPAFVPFRPGKWHANLPLLARERLRATGLRSISGGDWCTVEAPSRFFSFRRDCVTGRMAAAIWIERR